MAKIPYKQADFTPLQKTKYGVGFHWTTWSAPKTGDIKDFETAVNEFDVTRFVRQVVETGAGHVMITTVHMKQHMPCPNVELEKILPGRTTKRDLLMEIADALLKVNIPLMLYYNDGFGDGDPEWKQAISKGSDDPGTYFEGYSKILSWMGEHYGKKVIAFWVDHIVQKITDKQWHDLTMAMKAGNPDRLVTYNSGVETHFMRTSYQDFWAGEVCRLNYFPREDMTPSGLPWYSFTSWHPDWDHYGCGDWGMQMHNRDLEWHSPCVDSVASYLDLFLKRKGAVTFNLMCYQDGTIYEPDLQVMRGIRKIFR